MAKSGPLKSGPAKSSRRNPAPDASPARKEGPFTRIGKARFEAVMQAAKASGLMSEKTSRIGGRISPALVEQAKKQTGIEADTDLIAFALANIALNDDFPDVFKQSRGAIDPALKLGF